MYLSTQMRTNVLVPMRIHLLCNRRPDFVRGEQVYIDTTADSRHPGPPRVINGVTPLCSLVFEWLFSGVASRCVQKRIFSCQASTTLGSRPDRWHGLRATQCTHVLPKFQSEAGISESPKTGLRETERPNLQANIKPAGPVAGTPMSS